MKERLEQLTMAEFVDMVCGELGVLAPHHIVADRKRLINTARDIAFEYRSIADEAGAARYLLKSERMTKTRMKVTLMTICVNMCRIGKYDEVRDILAEANIRTKWMNDQRLALDVGSRLERAKGDLRRMEDKEKGKEEKPEDIRAGFDSLTAALMAHYKFQIDMATIKASVYAHLVARYNREVKAIIAASRRRNR